MEFSMTELQIIESLAKGMAKPKELAKAIDKSPQQTNLSLKSLEKKGIISLKRGDAGLSLKTHVALLAKRLVTHPNLKGLLSDSGIRILSATLNPLSVKELMKETGLKKSIIYRKIKQAFNISVLRKENSKYFLNEKIWPDLKEMLVESRNYELIIDPRVPPDGLIYFKNDSEIVFSSTQEREAFPTAFSAYKDYGISIFSPVNYYYLPERKLSIKEVFLHSLYVVEKSKEYRELLYVILFYLKHINALKGINNPILKQLKRVLSGEKISGYPDMSDIREKAAQYSIKVDA